MRRKDEEISDMSKILKIIDKCKVLRIGLLDNKDIYIVPMNFGYSYEKNKLTFYFHCAKSGRRIDILNANNHVGFEMDCNHGLITAESPCDYGYKYESIIGNGTAQFIENYDDKIYALKMLMKHQTGQEFEFDHKMADEITVFKIYVESLSCKKGWYISFLDIWIVKSVFVQKTQIFIIYNF